VVRRWRDAHLKRSVQTAEEDEMTVEAETLVYCSETLKNRFAERSTQPSRQATPNGPRP